MQIFGSGRRLKRLAIGLVVLIALLLIANGFMAWRTESRFRSVIASIRVANEPASIRELAPPAIPASENAAAILEKLGSRLDAFSKDYTQFFDTALGKVYVESSDKGTPPTREQTEAIHAILNKYGDLSDGIASASRFNKYASLSDFSVDHQTFLDNSLKQPIRRIRTATYFLGWHAEVSTVEGHPEMAVEQGLELLRLVRLYDSEPLLVNFLVAVAVREYACRILYDGLNAGPMPPQVHAEVERELALHDNPQRILHAVKTDRAYSASVIAELASHPPAGSPQPPWSYVVAWPVKRHFVGALEYIDPQLTLIETSWPRLNRSFGRTGAPERSGLGPLADLLAPAIQAAYGAERKIVGVMRSLRVFNALCAFAEKNGREAKGLEELGLPREATIDPFSGEPLKLKHTDEGWIVYSVMTNGVDDGGDFKDLKDYGLAPRKWRRTQ